MGNRVNPFGSTGPNAPRGLGMISAEMAAFDRGPRLTPDKRRAVELAGDYQLNPGEQTREILRSVRARDEEMRAQRRIERESEALEYIQKHNGMPDELSLNLQSALVTALMDSRKPWSWDPRVWFNSGFECREVVLQSFWQVRDPGVMTAVGARIDEGVKRMPVKDFLTMVADAIGTNPADHTKSDSSDNGTPGTTGGRGRMSWIKDAVECGALIPRFRVVTPLWRPMPVKI